MLRLLDRVPQTNEQNKAVTLQIEKILSEGFFTATVMCLDDRGNLVGVLH